MAHPDETTKALPAASQLEARVAAVEIRSRTAYPDPAPGAAFAEALAGVVPTIRAENLTAAGADLERAAATLPDLQPISMARRG